MTWPLWCRGSLHAGCCAPDSEAGGRSHCPHLTEREARPAGARQHTDPAHGAPNAHAATCQMNHLQTEILEPGSPALGS